MTSGSPLGGRATLATTVTDDRREQIARNESRFREVNETLDEGLRKVSSVHGDLAGFVCECGDTACSKLVYASLGKYEEVRASPRRFLIAPGHELADLEDVVEQGPRYTVIEKHDDVTDIVKGTDPRG
jgi:hypothetical protein